MTSASLDFESDPGGDLPAGLMIAETRNSGSTFDLLLSNATFPADLRCSVTIHPGEGKEDQRGGLVWRARGGDDDYIARWNPLERNLRAYKVVGAKRILLESAMIDTEPTQ